MLTLRPFQQEDLDTLTKNNYRALIANAPGTGKTILCLSSIARNPDKLLPVVIISPASVVRNWRKEARKWVPGMKIHLVEDTTTPIPDRPADIYILSWSLLPLRWRDLAAKNPQMIIGDEIHFAKNEQALRTQAMSSLCARTPHLLLLSGTPIINETEELDAIKNLFGAKQPVMIRRLLEDVAKDIPPKTRARVTVELPPKVATRYRSAAEDFAAWLEKEMSKRMSAGDAEDAAARALAAEALIKIGYLRRILAVGKVFAASDLTARLVRAGEPVVLFAEHKAVMQRLQKCLATQRIPFVVIDGSTSPKDRHRAVELFQRNLIPVFIGSKAAKEGLTLTAARHLIFVERYWTSAEEEQGEDRIRRIGQTSPTKIWFLHVADTVDDRISAIIDRKRRLVRQAIGAATIAETPEKTVAAMLAEWSTHAGAPAMTTTALGISAPLPPLPPSRDVHAIRFKNARWQPKSALAWCKMLGYKPTSSTLIADGFEFIIQPAAAFTPGAFTLFRVAQDITMYVGTRPKSK
jgi:SNF2 family DNA or RNA helicase